MSELLRPTAEDIGKIRALVEKLAKPRASPERNPALWAQAMQQEQKELAESLKRRASCATPRFRIGGADSSPAQQLRADQEIEGWESGIYLKLDPEYAQKIQEDDDAFRKALDAYDIEITPFQPWLVSVYGANLLRELRSPAPGATSDDPERDMLDIRRLREYWQKWAQVVLHELRRMEAILDQEAKKARPAAGSEPPALAAPAREQQIANHIIFVDVVDYSKEPIERQLKIVGELKRIAQECLKQVKLKKASYVALPTGDGMALCLISQPPERAAELAIAVVSTVQKPSVGFQIRTAVHFAHDATYIDINGRLNVETGGRTTY